MDETVGGKGGGVGWGAAINSKGSNDLPGRKMLHFLAAIAFNRGVVLVLHYEHMTGKYFCDFNSFFIHALYRRN